MNESSVQVQPSETLNTSSVSTLTNCELTHEQQRQIEREKRYRDEALGKRQRDDTALYQSGRGSQTMVAKGFLQTLVPGAAYWLNHHIETVKRRSSRVGHSVTETLRLNTWVDAETCCHIAVSVILDSLGRGASFKTSIGKVQIFIGEQIEDQAFIAYMSDADPMYFKKLRKWYLNDPIRTYQKKVYAMKYTLDNADQLEWNWMDSTEHARVGALLLRAVMSVPVKGYSEGLFESRMVHQSKNKTVNYLGFSKTGLRYRDVLQEMMDQMVYKPKPMVCPPIPWTLEERGGFLLDPPRRWGELVHSNLGTVPSQTALDALNRLQAQPYKINTYILDLQKQLLNQTWEIGSFRSYEKDTWKAEHFPIVDSEHLDSLDKSSSEYKSLMRKLRNAYHNQKLDEKKSCTPRRIVYLAEEFRDETFWTPFFTDSRLRLYPQSELSITGGDYVKGLLVNANPKPITASTRDELLIAIATSGDFGKVSKKSFVERLEWGEEFVKTEEFRAMVEDPFHCRKWMDADECFQFLSYCEEYYALFVSFERRFTRVWIGKDQTCSGIQILSSMIGDAKAMEFTNVIPSEFPKDAYGEVARCAIVLLTDKNWLSEQYDKFKQKDDKWNAANPDLKQRKTKFSHKIPLELVDRGLCKHSVLITGYGGSSMTKREHILDDLKKVEDLDFQDRILVVNAILDAMTLAFPQYKELNDWFRSAAITACKGGAQQLKWYTPNGSLIVQDYREPEFTIVRTHAASGGHYSRLISDDHGDTYVMTGWGDVKGSKHSSAIAANLVHSLDATIIQNGMVRLKEGVDCVTVHDCLYFQPGYEEDVVPVFRQAFYGVVTTPVLQSFIDENGLEEMDVENPTNNLETVIQCLESAYLFS
jgi:DNA-directed RNA polymerase